MNIKRAATAIGLAIAVILTGAGCSKRQIDVNDTGSEKVQGTSWYRFCDGPNAVIWVPGLSGDADELEAYVYDHWACAPQWYQEEGESVPTPERPADDDGISEDEEN